MSILLSARPTHQPDRTERCRAAADWQVVTVCQVLPNLTPIKGRDVQQPDAGLHPRCGRLTGRYPRRGSGAAAGVPREVRILEPAPFQMRRSLLQEVGFLYTENLKRNFTEVYLRERDRVHWAQGLDRYDARCPLAHRLVQAEQSRKPLLLGGDTIPVLW